MHYKFKKNVTKYFLLYTNNIYDKKINLYIYNNNNNKTKFKKQNKLNKYKFHSTIPHDTILVYFNKLGFGSNVKWWVPM